MTEPDLIHSSTPVTERMQSLIDSWQARHDRRVAFLACYRMMTTNMLIAIDQGEFYDPGWVNTLLNHFAGYYFNALEAYEGNDPATPAIWRLAFDVSNQPGILILQNLLLGMNAHINYDLVFTLVDMLEPEWARLTPAERQRRYWDHAHVNTVIRRTIDAVQDTIIEPDAPLMKLADVLLGRADEWMVSRMIGNWRKDVWTHARRLLDAADPDTRQCLAHEIEREALERANLILRV